MSAPIPGGHTAPPLHGIRVLDLTRLLPGAYCTQLLGDLGAEVVKVEDPRGGDTMRTLNGAPSKYFARLNRGKKSVTLNLKAPDAPAVLDALIAGADVFVESFRPSTARRLGVDAATIRTRHPRLICASISGFGQSGPRAEVAAHDLNYQALAGLLRPPALPGPLVGDIGSAHDAALAIVAALFNRTRTGEGASIDISIHGSAAAWAQFPTTADLTQPRYNLYETADGEWLALGALEKKFWEGFCARADLAVTASVDEVRSRMRERTRAEWLQRFEGADVCLTTVIAAEAAPLKGRPTYGEDERRAPLERGQAPELGADTDAILDAAGIGADERVRLRAAGAI